MLIKKLYLGDFNFPYIKHGASADCDWAGNVVHNLPSLAGVFGAETAEEGGIQSVRVSVEQGKSVACEYDDKHGVACGNYEERGGCSLKVTNIQNMRREIATDLYLSAKTTAPMRRRWRVRCIANMRPAAPAAAPICLPLQTAAFGSSTA